MKGMLGAVVLGSLLIASAPGAADAQARGYVRVGGGANIPIGDLSDGVKTGWLGQVVGGVMFTDMIGARVNGTYGQNNVKDPGTGKVKYISALADVTVSPRTSGKVSPYVLAGAGILNGKNGESQTAFAWNAGAGVKFAAGSLGVYLEARFLSSKKSGFTSNMIPISAGVQFGGMGGM